MTDRAIRTLSDALAAEDALIVRMQDAMRAYLPPNSGITGCQFATIIIGLLDGPDQRAAQGKARDALQSLAPLEPPAEAPWPTDDCRY